VGAVILKTKVLLRRMTFTGCTYNDSGPALELLQHAAAVRNAEACLMLAVLANS